MKKLLMATALVLAFSCSASAGYTGCTGTVVVGSEWTTIADEAPVPLPKDHPRYTPNAICRFKTASALGKRILNKCPDGSKCELSLSIANHPKDHRWEEDKFFTIIKWPEDGVHKIPGGES
jgi:hypothetical protein